MDAKCRAKWEFVTGLLLVKFISIGNDQTAKHVLGYKFFSADYVRVTKTFLGCLLPYAWSQNGTLLYMLVIRGVY